MKKLRFALAETDGHRQFQLPAAYNTAAAAAAAAAARCCCLCMLLLLPLLPLLPAPAALAAAAPAAAAVVGVETSVSPTMYDLYVSLDESPFSIPA